MLLVDGPMLAPKLLFINTLNNVVHWQKLIFLIEETQGAATELASGWNETLASAPGVIYAHA
jgi:hypothetical protein